VAVANFALWRLQVFNQLVGHLTDFNTQHAVEIRSDGTTEARRGELADAAVGISALLHEHGIGWAWSQFPDGGRGWYGALVEAMGGNLRDLDIERQAHRQRWWREWPYLVGDALVVAVAVALVVSVVC
jgi:hypothetical protein